MKRAWILLVVALLIGASACSKNEGATAVLPDGVKLPTDPSGDCKDPVADIGGDTKGGSGTLADPAGIDIVAAEAKVVGGVLKTKLTMAGAVASAPAPTVIVDQGNPGQEVSFELRAAPTGAPTGPWGLTLITWKPGGRGGIEERSAPLTGSTVVVNDKTVSFDIATKDLPPIATLLWNFGASSGDGDNALLDDCNNAVEQTRGTEGPSTTTTTIPVGSLGQEQPFKTTSKVTVYAVQSPPKVPKVLAVQPDEGFKLAVVDAQVCATDARIDARTSNFNVKLTNNQIYPIWRQPQSGADPAFPATQSLPPTECIRGWITFQIPFDATVASVSYSGASDNSGVLVWKL